VDSLDKVVSIPDLKRWGTNPDLLVYKISVCPEPGQINPFGKIQTERLFYHWPDSKLGQINPPGTEPFRANRTRP